MAILFESVFYKGKMPCTICKITPQGVDAFEEYVEALKTYIMK